MSKKEEKKLKIDKKMLSIERTKELLKDKNISDEEAEKIRDDLYQLAEIIFDSWMRRRKAGRNLLLTLKRIAGGIE